MTIKIQNRYSSIVRELDLSGSPNYELQETVVPVVVLHEHCGDVSNGNSASRDGAGGAEFLATYTFPVSGSYQITMYMDWSIAVSAREAARFYIGSPSDDIRLLLWYINFGNTNNQAGHAEMTIPRVHIREGERLLANLVSVILAADNVTMGFVVQTL